MNDRACLTSAEPDIEALAARSRQGCLASFEELMLYFEGRVYRYIYQLTRHEQDAQDLTQITFVKAFQNIHTYESRGAFACWLFTIAKRTVLNHFRGSRSFQELPENLEGGGTSPSHSLESKDTCADLWQMARSLKPAQYEALWLRYGEGFSIAETARVMKTNALRVRVLVHRGRSALHEKWSHRAQQVAEWVPRSTAGQSTTSLKGELE